MMDDHGQKSCQTCHLWYKTLGQEFFCLGSGPCQTDPDLDLTLCVEIWIKDGDNPQNILTLILMKPAKIKIIF